MTTPSLLVQHSMLDRTLRCLLNKLEPSSLPPEGCGGLLLAGAAPHRRRRSTSRPNLGRALLWLEAGLTRDEVRPGWNSGGLRRRRRALVEPGRAGSAARGGVGGRSGERRRGCRSALWRSSLVPRRRRGARRGGGGPRPGLVPPSHLNHLAQLSGASTCMVQLLPRIHRLGRCCYLAPQPCAGADSSSSSSRHQPRPRSPRHTVQDAQARARTHPLRRRDRPPRQEGQLLHRWP